MKKKKWLAALMIFSLLTITACGQSSQSSQNTPNSSDTASASAEDTVINMKSADNMAADSAYGQGMELFAKLLNEDTNGIINVKHFPAGQLGKDLDVVEGVKMGSIDIAVVGAAQNRVTDALSIPFLFEDAEHMNKVLRGEIGKKLREKYEEETGIKLIGFAYFAPRMLTTNGVEVKTPEDLKGLKIRVPENPIMVDTWKSLGASPTPIAFTELFSALQTGVVHAQENPYEIILQNSFYEVQDTLIETFHSIPARYLIMNKKRYDSLTPEQQELIETNWLKAADFIEQTYLENDAKFREELIAKGMKIVQPDIDAFREATQDVWKKYAPEAWGEGVYEEIQALRKQ